MHKSEENLLGTARSTIDLVDQSQSSLSNAVHGAASHPIQIRRGRKQSLFLQTIEYLAQQQDSSGRSFQPCLEDLLILFGGNRKHTDGVIRVLKRKELLERIYFRIGDRSKYLPDLLVLSQKGIQKLYDRRKNGLTSFEEWRQVLPRIKQLLRDPQIHFLDDPNVTFHQVREIVRLSLPYLPALPAIDNDFIAKIVAFNKNKQLSANELCTQVLGYVDALLRLQGDYLSHTALRKIIKILEDRGLRADIGKRKLYPYIQIGARLFGAEYRPNRKELFYQAVEKALNQYCNKFEIAEPAKQQILSAHNQLAQLGRISLDPEARALGIMGYAVEGFFHNGNQKRFPLPPEMWLTGRDQMHQIRKLFRKFGD
ncbi:MAG: hypothetical protein ACFFGZ_05535 [Candidatus Thorarchaeota archaeon]